MRNQIVQWIFLPGGMTEDGQLAASLFVAPRLRSDEGSTLADFPDFLDWPATLGSHLTQLILQRLSDLGTEAPMQVIGGGNSAIWQALFPPETPVRPFVFDDFADRPLITYPLRKILEYLTSRWATLAEMSTDDLPFSSIHASPIGQALDVEQIGGQTLPSVFHDLMATNRMGIFEGAPGASVVSGRMANALRSAAAQAAALAAQHHTTPQRLIQPFDGGDNHAGHFYQLACFHRRPISDPGEFPRDADAARGELNEKMEFHHLLSSLGDHPALLRELGLVFDLVVRPEFLPTLAEQDPPSSVRVQIQRPSSYPTRSNPAQSPWNLDVTPWTQCRLIGNGPEGASFSAAELPFNQDFAHGFVRLDPERFSVATVDVDGLALKALNMATTLATQEERQRPVEEEARAGAPAPRTGGVALVHAGRAQELHNDFYLARNANDNLERDPTGPSVLTAEQLVRGYRMDVFDADAGEWHSLHARRVTYTPLRDPGKAFTVEDEGFLQVSLTGESDRPPAPNVLVPVEPPEIAAQRPLYLHEALATWDGWSMAAPRPGNAIQQEPAPPAASADLGLLKLDLAIKALPASLPRLRFGRSYRLRLRMVDLAGKSHNLHRANNLSNLLDDSGLPQFRVTLPDGNFVYRRLEPVPPPELVPRHIFSPGEGLERLVVRSNAGISAVEYAAASAQPVPAGDVFILHGETLIFHPFCDRHVAPPKTSLQLAETHGKFDEAIDAARGLLPEHAAAAVGHFYSIASRENGSFRDHPHARFIETGRHQDDPQGYVTIDADEVALPYLLDPFSRGALIRLQFSPNQPEQRFEIEFGKKGDWYELLPFRLRLEEGHPPSGHYDDAQHLFTVRLPKGRIARMRLNNLFLDDADLFEIMAWCRAKLSPEAADSVLQAIRESRHWMTTPWRTLTLVHALQQPLFGPDLELADIENGSLKRQKGATAAELTGKVQMDGASTASLELAAEWDDVVDDPALGKLDMDHMQQHVRANAFKIVLPEPWGTPWAPEIRPFLEALDSDGGQEWEAVRFSTFSDQAEMLTPQDTRAELLRQSADPSNSVQERNRLAAAAAQLEGLRSHEFGDTKYRRVDYQMVATTRFREYFDPDMPVEKCVRRGNVVTVDVLSSAPPLAPVVLDVVPIVRWERAGTAGSEQFKSTRVNAGLRIWLARPWFSSGAGEMLGLVCGVGDSLNLSNQLDRELTVISQDPAHATVMPAPLRVHSFPSADFTAMNVPLMGQNLSFNVAAFHPRYDLARDAWYCDIQIETGESYFPFVRLGLVRFQPKSLRNCQASSIVPTAYLQPLPDRSLTVIRQTGDTVAVKLRGPVPQARRGMDGSIVIDTNAVVAVVEVQVPHTSDPELAWIPAGWEAILEPDVLGATTVEWTGEVNIPAGTPGPLRLAVREYELHPTDDRSSGLPTPVLGRRLVHADVVPIG